MDKPLPAHRIVFLPTTTNKQGKNILLTAEIQGALQKVKSHGEVVSKMVTNLSKRMLPGRLEFLAHWHYL